MTSPRRRPAPRWLTLPNVLAACAVAAACASALVLLRAPAVAQGAGPLTKTPDGRPLALAFSDEFDQAGPGPGPRWATTYGDGKDQGVGQRTIPTNDELELYVDRAYGDRIGAPGLNPFEAKDGLLHIRALPAKSEHKDKLSGRTYTSGVITTFNTRAQLYGYFEVRARLPRGKGLWPAIWMLPADQTWPPEIDIVESIGDPTRAYFTAHSKVVPSNTVEGRVSEGFHTYAVSWDPQSIIWYVDGKETSRQPTPADMTKPMYLIINLAVGGKWPGVPDASTKFPAELSVDYARIYTFAP